MAPSRPSRASGNGIERIRDELLTALHLGKLTPGDRAPSVRRLADRTGMNRKTVHRAYVRLAQEGLLDLRPGSGTFISDLTGRDDEGATPGELIRFANRCKAAADELGLGPARLAAFLEGFHGSGLRDLRLTVAECNGEQLGLISEELQGGLGTEVRPVLLASLAASPRASVEGSVGIVTTDCHRSEVEALALPTGLPVYRLAMDSAFPQRLLDEARRTPRVIMVVQDRRFSSVFLRLLQRLSASEELRRRFVVVEASQARSLLRRGCADATVYVSPLVERAVAPFLPADVPRIHARWRLEQGSLERLKASLAFDRALRGVARQDQT